MDIFKEWKKIEQEKFNHSPIKKEHILEAIYQKSTSTMETLKTRLKYKMNWILFFMICFSGAMVWQFDNTPLLLIFGAMLIAYGLGYFGLKRYYDKMGVRMEGLNTLEVMKLNYEMITKALRFETNATLPIYPFMLLGGILIPGLIRGEGVIEILSEPKYLIALLVGTIVLVPLMKILADKANKYAYQAYISKLEDNIIEMEKIG